MRSAAVLALLAGCTWATPSTPSARVQHGPAYAATPHLLAALPIDCPTCTPQQRAAVAVQTRMNLEYAGYSVIDSELLNAEARRRFTRTREDERDSRYAPSTGRSESVERAGGAGWADISPPQQAELLATLGVDGVLHEAVVMQGSLHVEVRLAIVRLDGALAWRAACDSAIGAYEPTAQVIDRAGRCAIESGALW